GLVSYHDCAWNGGHCEESPDGAKCVDASDGKACFLMSNDCTGSKLSMCVSGVPTVVDCASFGMHCEKLPTGAADVDGGCGFAPCAAPVCVVGAGDAGKTDGG